MRIRCNNCSKIYNEDKKECPRCGKDNSLAPEYVDGDTEFETSQISGGIKKKAESFASEFDYKYKEANDKTKSLESISIEDIKTKFDQIVDKTGKNVINLLKRISKVDRCEFCGEELFVSSYICPRCKKSYNCKNNTGKTYNPEHFSKIHREFLAKTNGLVNPTKYLNMAEYEGLEFDKWNSNYNYRTGIRSNVLLNMLIWSFGSLFFMSMIVGDYGGNFANPGVWIIFLLGNMLVPFISKHIYERKIDFYMKNIDYEKSSRYESESYSTSVDELDSIELVLYNGFHADSIIFNSKRETAKNYVVFSLPVFKFYKNDELAIYVLMFCMKHHIKLSITRSRTADKKDVHETIASAYVNDDKYQESNTYVDATVSQDQSSNIKNSQTEEKVDNKQARKSFDKGYVHVYTGNGKGKTTAAFGVALRAVCSGKRVYIGQFVKDMKYSETKVAEKYDNILIEQLGAGCFIDKDPTDKDLEIAKKSLEKCADILEKGDYDLVILDEITIALLYKLLKEEDVIKVIKNRAEHVEVIITGRYASEGLIEIADLVTEMKEIKHYYSQGVLSREGIDC